MMPGIDGFETIKRIRDIDPKVSAVIMSGKAIERFAESTAKNGVYISVAKPITIEQIEEINKAYEMIKDQMEIIYDNPYGFDIEKLKGARILVADDEKEIVKVVTECLSADGFTSLDTAKDGEEAIEKFNTIRYDLVIIDIMMPKKNGIEVLRHVKAISPESQVIIITANASKGTAIAAIKLGAYDFIEKPIEFEMLSRIVGRAIEKKLLIDEIK